MVVSCDRAMNQSYLIVLITILCFGKKTEGSDSNVRSYSIERDVSHSIVSGEYHMDTSVSSSFSVSDEDCFPSCSPWLVCNATSNKCECMYDYHGVIKCGKKYASVLDCYCATYLNDSDTNDSTMVAGSCFYNCENNDKLYRDVLYHQIKGNSICDSFNRTGILCGKCQDYYYPIAYSFSLKCIDCPNNKQNWMIFFVLATVPSTLFVFAVLFFRLNVTSSYLHGFVLFSQGMSFPANMRIILRAISKQPTASIFAKIIASLYGFWNLDFFRPLIPDICLHLSTLQVLSLDYIVAVYPLLLIMSIYIVVTLYYYYHNVRIIAFISRPFRRILACFPRSWNVRSSVMNAYATFFLLSYTKFLSASFDILMPTHVCFSTVNKCIMASYYDANLEYFKGDHLPLALTALVIVIIFIAIPTLILLLYPFHFFQVVLKKLKLQNSLLDQFVSPFYQCYKDGTAPKTYNCRWFASLFLILRIILPLVYAFTLGSVFFPLAVIIIFIFVMILITVKPYKHVYAHYIKFDVTFLVLLALFYLSMISIDVSSIKDHRLVHVSYVLTIVFGTVPLIYVFIITIYWMISKRTEIARKFTDLWKVQKYEREVSFENEVPDRLLNPTEYMNNSTSLRVSGSGGYITKETY